MRFEAVAIFALIVGSALSLGQSAVAQGVEISLNIPGEAPLYDLSGQPVMVAGLWHQLSVSLPSPPTNSVTLRAFLPGSESEGMSGYYEWVRDEADNGWFDPLYSFFIRPELSSVAGPQITFHLGIDAAATPGAWTLEVIRDGSLLSAQPLEVRSPEMGFGLSAADFNFRAEPFQALDLSSAGLGQYLRVINQGNVPLRFSVSFDRLQGRLSLVNPSEIVHLNADARYFVHLSLDPRPPQIIPVKGVSRAEAIHLIPSPGASRLVPAIEGEFSLKVVVGRGGYSVQSFGTIIFQTLETLRADYGSLVVWQVYLTGSQEVSFDVDVTGARLVGVLQGEDQLALPAMLRPSPTAEMPLTLQVMTDTPSTVAEVVFTLGFPDTGEVRTYLTTIAVGARPPAGPLQASLLWLIASLMTATVLAVVSYNHLRLAANPQDSRPGVVPRGRRRGRKEKEDGEGKRQKAGSTRGKQSEGGGTPSGQGRSKEKGPP